MKIFDTSYYNSGEYRKDAALFTRHGETWDAGEKARLKERLTAGADLRGICIAHGRTPNAILSMLKNMGLIEWLPGEANEYYIVEPVSNAKEEVSNPINAVDTAESETDMNKDYTPSYNAIATPFVPPLIETRTFIEGRDAHAMTDEQIYAIIERKENEMRKWDGLNNKPKKIEAARAKLQEEIAALVTFVDSRE